jgi:hypothetical protein
VVEGWTTGVTVSVYETVRDILDPGVDAVEAEHSEIKDAMNLMGRIVAAVEHLAKCIDERDAQAASQ